MISWESIWISSADIAFWSVEKTNKWWGICSII